ncbi:MAG: ComF family protein [Candidatus Magasanikiibacteriota bacterium]
MILKSILEKLKDYVFPVFCLNCKKEGGWLCEQCFNKLNLQGIFDCPVCHKNTVVGECCFDCKEKSILNSHIAITKYEDNSLIGKVIQTLKYSWAEDVLAVMEKMIEKFVNNHSELFSSIDFVVPVPLHQKRYVERGFNQAELIARVVAKKINKPFKDVVVRTRHTRQQAKLNRADRLENLQEAFSVEEKLIGNILIVDDVFTTGSTIQECAKALKNAGADRVFGFSIARG